MRRFWLTLLAAAIVLYSFSGCKKNDSQGRGVRMENLGLEYVTPGVWENYFDTNIYRLVMIPRDALAMVQYSYITMAGVTAMTTSQDAVNLEDYLTPICAILVYHKDNEKAEGVSDIIAGYSDGGKLAEHGNYVYHGLWNYKSQYEGFANEDFAAYEAISAVSSGLMDTVATFDFDPGEIISQGQLADTTLTFMTKTIKGGDITSQVFGDYDLTMVSFWASYCYPDINELPALQKLYAKLSDLGSVNLILAVIDTPEGAAEATAALAMDEARCEFDAIKMDTTIGTWVMNNLNGLPTTVFVDKNARIVGEPLEGIKGIETYTSEIRARLPEAIRQAASP